MVREGTQSRLVFLAGLGALLGSCATEPAPRPVALDPSNPTGAESPPLVVGSALHPAPAPSEKTTGADGGKAGKQEPILYTCPMHPEVISDKPGRCPKCGMQLVPKKPAPSEGQK